MSYINASQSITGVILAGGKSSRMGSNKAFMKYQDKQLIDHAWLLLKKMGLSNILISGKLDGYKCIEDSQEHLGPIGGIYSAMNFVSEETTSVVFIPVDMPLLKDELLYALLKNIQDYEAISYQGYPLPFVVTYSERTCKVIYEMYNQLPKEGSVKMFLAKLKTKMIKRADGSAELFMNVNTPEDYSKLPD